jgi:hypothetical protein
MPTTRRTPQAEARKSRFVLSDPRGVVWTKKPSESVAQKTKISKEK